VLTNHAQVFRVADVRFAGVANGTAFALPNSGCYTGHIELVLAFQYSSPGGSTTAGEVCYVRLPSVKMYYGKHLTAANNTTTTATATATAITTLGFYLTSQLLGNSYHMPGL